MSRKGARNRQGSASAIVTVPQNRLIAMVARVLAGAKSQPSVLALIKNMVGSISGDVSQNAINVLSGMPNIRKAAIKGIISHEQKVDRPPSSAATTIIPSWLPVKALAIRVSAPLALSPPMVRMANKIKGACQGLRCRQIVMLTSFG